ncbi:MAG: transketolase C-terminal domain-containing protein [Candidatus Omnitrophica bacterium]|nr:transketolase C-terminal domain-containing protein [Candidatus Omnitrophota bacterium]
MTKRTLTFSSAVNEALHEAMQQDKNVICYGLGVDDPKGVFGTTLRLKEDFGPTRVFDMPTSENAMTGIAIGAALNGVRPVMTHQRLDFFLLAMDQLVNNAAKWRYMFGGKGSVPITIRLILGRGWGQGPTHSQNLQSWFAHIPGLKIVVPSTAQDAKGLLLSSIFDSDPVVFLEHRWLHNLEGDVPLGDFRVPLGKARILNCGDAVTIVAFSYMTVEALYAVDILGKSGINCDLIDLRTLCPLDWESIFLSVRKTGRLLVLDTSNETCSMAGEIVARVSMKLFDSLKAAPRRIALPDVPTPTSPALSEVYYKDAVDIVKIVSDMFKKEISVEALSRKRTFPHDVPGDWFKGPF